MKKVVFPILIILSLGIAAYLRLNFGAVTDNGATTSLIPLLTEGGSTGFKKAIVPDAIAFPRDLGAHNEYQTEWWYYTGNLESGDGREFGFQLTFFRRAIAPLTQEEELCSEILNDNLSSSPGSDCQDKSSWRTNQLYLAHFTISDVANEAFYPFERFSRGAAGLAGAQSDPYHVWLEDWQAVKGEDGRVRLQARAGDISLNLILTETLPPILHGDGGLSVKGPEPGNASYYYSLVQQQAVGAIGIKGTEFEVTGKAWMDHEYSTSALSPGAVGWDWFSIQLDDGSALMFFQIRNKDGQIEPASSGTYIFPDGSTRPVHREEWNLDVLETWTSPNTTTTYPAAWKIEIPTLNLVLYGQPLMPNQELNVSSIYWEGATGFEGSLNGQSIRGEGYVELTGYGEGSSTNQ